MSWKQYSQVERKPVESQHKIQTVAEFPPNTRARITVEVWEPEYKVVKVSSAPGSWVVRNSAEANMAWFYASHPNAWAAAHAECARLNGEASS